MAFPNTSPNSTLRPVIKTVKMHYDNPRALRSYAFQIRRHLFLERDYEDTTWHGEAFHQLALLEGADSFPAAESLLLEALSKFEEHHYLARARVLRDQGLLVAIHRDPEEGLLITMHALKTHDGDFKNLKGRRERRLTESYVWRVQLLVDSESVEARESLIKYALSGCRDCSIRDQHKVIIAAMPYANGAEKQLLDARLIGIYARRYKLSRVAVSTTKLVIDTELRLANHIIRRLLWKE